MTSRPLTLFRSPAVQVLLGFVLLVVGSIAAMTVGTAVGIAYAGQGRPAQPQLFLMTHPWPGLAVGMAVEALVGYFGYRTLVRRFEQREPLELAGPGAVAELLQGAAVGLVFCCVVMAVLTGAGAYRPSGIALNVGLPLGAMVGLGAAFLEEPVFRGLLLRRIDQRYGAPIAIGVVSVLFGLVHAANGLSTGVVPWWGMFAIVIEAGLLLNAAYYVTRRLWFPIGLHAAWNFTLGGLFGLPVSGVAGGPGLVTGTLSGPELLTGGSFGPEGSVVTVGLGLLFGIALLAWARRRGRLGLQPPTLPTL